jgi:hypothetical protein
VVSTGTQHLETDPRDRPCFPLGPQGLGLDRLPTMDIGLQLSLVKQETTPETHRLVKGSGNAPRPMCIGHQGKMQGRRFSLPPWKTASVPQGNTAVAAPLTEEGYSARMGPPLHEPEKPSAENDLSPVTLAAQQGIEATSLPNPANSSEPLHSKWTQT